MVRKISVVFVAAFITLSFSIASKAADEVIVSIYHVATGKHLDFLKWQAKRDAISRELGFPADRWYVHANGDSWDYLVISHELSDEQDKQLDAKLKEKGISSGFKAGLELRNYISRHTDTFAKGPVTLSELLQMAE